jgi:hypothetical protein
MKDVKTNLEPVVAHQGELGEGEELIVTAVPRELESAATRSYMDDLNFYNEDVEIMFHPPSDPNDTSMLVTLSVNGRDEHFLRGQWKKVKRCYLECAVMARRESWTFGTKVASDGSTRQTEFASQNFRMPFTHRDANPKGQEWYQKLVMRPV